MLKFKQVTTFETANQRRQSIILCGLLVVFIAFQFAKVTSAQISTKSGETNVTVIGDFETESAWDSIVRQNSNAHGGSYAGYWADHPRSPETSRTFSPALQIPEGQKFQFWLHSAVANRAGVSIVLESDDAATDGVDHFIYDLKIDWTGWRFFNLPIEEFRRGGSPGGWNRIEKIRFNTNGWDNQPAPDTALTFDDLQFAPPIISATRATSRTVDGRTLWQHHVTLHNNTGKDQEFRLSVESDSKPSLELNLSQELVAIKRGQAEQIVLEVTLPDRSQTPLNLLDANKVDLSVLVGDKRIDNLLIPTYPALPSHPRLYVQAEDVEKIRARYDDPSLAYLKRQLTQQRQATDSGRSSNQRANITIRRSIEARAFLYLIKGDKNNGRKAVEMTIEYLDSLQKKYDTLKEARELYEGIIAAAITYDWCYDLLSDQQRTQLISGIYKVASLSEFGWPFSEQPTYLTGHFGEHAPVALLAAGIAIFDEDQKLFNTIYPGFVEGLAPSRNAFYPMGKHHQGTSYAVGRFFYEAHSAFLFDAINFDGIYRPEQNKVPYHTLYARTPSGKSLTEGDIFDPKNTDPRNHFIMAQLYDDPYLMQAGVRLSNEGNHWTLEDSARSFVFWDSAAPKRALDELPTARYFPSPSGSMVARTGWDVEGGAQSNVAMALMNIGEYYFGNHSHLDAGHFGFYYKGTLALDSGVYESSTGGYNSRHSRNYYQRTIAHNSLLIEDPNEPLMLHYGYPVETRDGGQYRQNYGNEWDSTQEMFDFGKRAEVLAHEIADEKVPEYTHLKGDLTAAYNMPQEYKHPAKVEEVVRSFVFLNLKKTEHPAALIVFDRITSTNKAFKKKWLLHSVEQPQVNGTRISIARTDGENNGRMVTDVLLPEPDNQQITKVGGNGREFWVDGRNVYESPSHPDVEPGAWRIELSPAVAAKSDMFLNVMQVMDAKGGPQPLPVTKLDSDKMVGVQIADRAVFFSKTAKLLGEEIIINVADGTEEVKTLVSDLHPGQWSVQSSRGTQKVTASDDGKSVYFIASPGKYTLQPASTSSGSGDSAKE